MKKEKVIEVIEAMPQNFELDALFEKLIFIEKVEEGLKDADEGRTISHEEVEKISKGWQK